MPKDLSLPFDKEQIKHIIEKYPTPFHIYDEKAIRANVRRFLKAFAWAPEFKEYFAVKATPNPHLLKILQEEGLGVDCSSMAELVLADKCGFRGEDIMLTSNETPVEEFAKAMELGAVLNLDDITHIAYLEENLSLPKTISFRYNPGSLRSGNAIIGNPTEAKYGLTHEQILEALSIMRDKGCEKFGLHTMVASNELHEPYFVETAVMMFKLIKEVHDKLGITVSFVNFGGGIGIPYRPEDEAVDLEKLGADIEKVYNEIIVGNNLAPLKICMECGRMITGPYGYLVTTAIHLKDTYKHYIGVDASMANLMRPGMYGAYHHLTVLGKENAPCDHIYDIVGSLCENCDKFAIDRALPEINLGDILVIHDTGAHGHAMGFNYNGKLRSAEILLKPDGSVKLIRRAETLDDLFATLDFSEI